MDVRHFSKISNEETHECCTFKKHVEYWRMIRSQRCCVSRTTELNEVCVRGVKNNITGDSSCRGNSGLLDLCCNRQDVSAHDALDQTKRWRRGKPYEGSWFLEELRSVLVSVSLRNSVWPSQSRSALSSLTCVSGWIIPPGGWRTHRKQ